MKWIIEGEVFVEKKFLLEWSFCPEAQKSMHFYGTLQDMFNKNHLLYFRPIVNLEKNLFRKLPSASLSEEIGVS